MRACLLFARYVHGGSAYVISTESDRLSASASQLGRGRIVTADIEHDLSWWLAGLCIHFVFSVHAQYARKETVTGYQTPTFGTKKNLRDVASRLAASG
jgi:hypothetical protein